MRNFLFWLSLILSTLLAFGSSLAFADQTIQGVWRIARIDRDYNSESNSDPLPSQIIFTNSHYSIVWMPGDEAMRAFKTRWEPTDNEKLQRFSEIVVNTGSYELDESRLRIEPVVARMPEFIGGYIDYEVQWSEGSMVLTFVDEVTFDDVRAPWVASRGVFEHLTLVRVKD
jgi:hypothetical protein